MNGQCRTLCLCGQIAMCLPIEVGSCKSCQILPIVSLHWLDPDILGGRDHEE